MPEGKLTATWARRYEDYPFSDTYSYLNGDLEKEVYREGIYVGYRYFDSFGVRPLWSFGYGLSYTSFGLGIARVLQTGAVFGSGAENIAVTNTGQTLCGAGKWCRSMYLCRRAGSKRRAEGSRALRIRQTVLLPGESRRSELMEIRRTSCWPVCCQERQAWIAEAGTYGVWVGNSLDSAVLSAYLTVAREDGAGEKRSGSARRREPFEELMPGSSSGDSERRAEEARRPAIPVCEFVPCREPEIQYVSAGRRTVSRGGADPASVREYHSGRQYARIGRNPGARFGRARRPEALEGKVPGIRSLIMADGPAGLRLRQSYQVDRETDSVSRRGRSRFSGKRFWGTQRKSMKTRTLTISTVRRSRQALLWRRPGIPSCSAEFGRAVAEEMGEFQVDLWLAPGMNIQRNPLCGT